MSIGIGLVSALVVATRLAVASAAEPVQSPSAVPPASGAASAPGARTPGKLAAERRAQLEAARFVYVSSTRKDGTLGKPAEIWFAVFDDAVWVASPPSAWRVKRIRWGRPKVRIAIGSPDGQWFGAQGEIVRDDKSYDRLCDQLAVKYSERWPRWEKGFRDGLRSGERLLIRYSPL